VPGKSRKRSYAAFRRIDGRHPLKQAVPDGYVDYAARRVRGSEVVYFNFALAKEMGLLSSAHPDRMNQELRQAILETFSLVIVNEWDLENDVEIPPADRLPGTYMATRYLQMQHPGRQGCTSGDGRSVWNGRITHDGVTWDVSSCGTGVTRLCPATAEQKKFFRTGNWQADYGCGTATIEEGLSSALMSETLHRNGIATERVLAVLETPSGFSINVRAGRNLLRPSHLFGWLKQGDPARLKGVADLFLDRQIRNGDLPAVHGPRRRYALLAESAARTFARIAATYESEYIFCWLDWDGDNILTDGGIIDYGSVRQFGLYHREYRFDDGPRWSTTIPEQRRKARLIVQNFVQIREFLVSGRKPSLASCADDPVLELFDEEFSKTADRLLLRNIGFDEPAQQALLEQAGERLRRFREAHRYFERAKVARGPRKIPDGITWNAIFSTRDLLRELPERYLEQGGPISPRAFLDIAASTFASRRDRRITAHRKRMALQFQREQLALIECAAKAARLSVPAMLTEVAARSAFVNRYDRITGETVLYATRKLIRQRKKLGPTRLSRVIASFVHHQTLVPELGPQAPAAIQHEDARRVFDAITDLAEELRHGH